MRNSVLLGIVALAIAGCGSSDTVIEVDESQLEQTSASERLKQDLAHIAETGEVGSAIESLRPTVDEVKAENAQLGEKLSAKLAELEKASEQSKPAQAKKVASEMVKMLP